jgi:hypothetical protein
VCCRIACCHDTGVGLFGVLAFMPTGCYAGAAGMDPAGLYAAMTGGAFGVLACIVQNSMVPMVRVLGCLPCWHSCRRDAVEVQLAWILQDCMLP